MPTFSEVAGHVHAPVIALGVMQPSIAPGSHAGRSPVTYIPPQSVLGGIVAIAHTSIVPVWLLVPIAGPHPVSIGVVVPTKPVGHAHAPPNMSAARHGLAPQVGSGLIS